MADMLGEVYVQVRADMTKLGTDMAGVGQMVSTPFGNIKLDGLDKALAGMESKFDASFKELEKDVTAFNAQLDKADADMQIFADHTRQLNATPLEKYEQQMLQLNQALRSGKMDQETFARATAAARKELMSGTIAASGFAGSIASMAAQIAPWATLIGLISAVTREYGKSTEAAKEQADADQKLKAALESSGGAAGLTASELKDHADALQNATGIADNEIQEFQARLLGFRNVQERVFERATDLAADWAAFYGRDMRSAAMDFGKSLNQPIEAISHLTRMGITFTKQQKDQIAHMVRAGHAEQAQGAILDALAKKFGGAAMAMAQGPQGQLRLLTTRLSEMREELGGKLVPFQTLALKVQLAFVNALSKAASIVGPIVKGLMKLNEATGGFIPLAIGATFVVYKFAAAWPVAAAAARAAMIAIQAALASTGWGLVIVAVGLIVAGVITLVKWLSTLKPVQQAWNRLVERLGEAWKHVMKAFEVIKPLVIGFFELTSPLLAAFLKDWDGTWKMIEKIVGNTISKIIDAVSRMILDSAKWIRVLMENWKDVWKIIELGAALMASRVIDTIKNLATIIAEILQVVMKKVTDAVAVVQTGMEGVAMALRGDLVGAAGKAAAAKAGAAGLAGGLAGALAGVGGGVGLGDKLLKRSPASDALSAELTKLIAGLFLKRVALEKDKDKDKKDARKKGDMDFGLGKTVQGFFGPEELAKKLQEAMLKDSATDKLLGATEEGVEVEKGMLGKLGAIDAALRKGPRIEVARV